VDTRTHPADGAGSDGSGFDAGGSQTAATGTRRTADQTQRKLHRMHAASTVFDLLYLTTLTASNAGNIKFVL